MGKYDLDNYAYDEYLKKKGKTRKVKDRVIERRNANKGYKGWHFGLGDRPVKCKDKQEFRHELKKRGLMMKDDVRRNLR